MEYRNIVYTNFTLTDIKANAPDDILSLAENFQLKGSLQRIELPSNPEYINIMTSRGFSFVDRTIGVSVSFVRSKVDYEKLIRFEMRRVRHEADNAIFRIARDSFPTDRRFHVRPTLDSAIAETVLESWIKDLAEVYVCLHKGKIVGFIDLETVNEKEKSIHLAAVEEKYRTVGAALSMYAYVLKKAREDGCEQVRGRISSINAPVMNLYASLDAFFQDPRDVYLKETENRT